MIGGTSVMFFRAQTLVLALVLFAGATASEAARVLAPPRFAPGSGIEMKITNFYEDIPPRGYLPLRVEVKNGSPAPREWLFQTMHTIGEARTVSFTTRLRVPARDERTFDLLIPLAAQASQGGRFSTLNVIVSGFGVTMGSTIDHSSSGSGRVTPYFGLGRALAVTHWGALRDALESASRSLSGSEMDHQLLPSDWRGLAGFDLMVFAPSEWRTMEAPARRAILDWVAQGGRLGFAYEGSAPDLPAAGGYGAGRLEHLILGEEVVPVLRSFIEDGEKGTASSLAGDYTWNWPVAERVGRAQPPRFFIIAFVLVFAALVGPINFMVLAPAGNRHRLFWTTPIISLSASLVMGLGIVLSEGFGGHGERVGLLWVDPSERRAVLWQEQVSRTGLLTTSSFRPEPTEFLTPIHMRRIGSSFFGGSRLTTYGFNADDQGGGIWSGDWFRSRTTQTQTLVTVSASRERVTVRSPENEPPIASSSFASTLSEFWYRDAEGTYWRAAKLEPGSQTVLKETPSSDFDAWWNARIGDAGPTIRSRAKALYDHASGPVFFADFPSSASVPTLPSIRWKPALGLLIGPIAP